MNDENQKSLSEKGRAALAYLQRGNCPIPVGNNKRPLISSWEQFQTSLPTKEQVIAWWTQNPNANIALICGHGGMVVLDIDVKSNPANQEIADKIAAAMKGKAPVVRTPSGGIHIHLRETDTKSKSAYLGTLGEFRASGLYVLVPPSDGYTYEE